MRTVESTVCYVESTEFTVGSTVYTVESTACTVESTMCTVESTVCTVHFRGLLLTLTQQLAVQEASSCQNLLIPGHEQEAKQCTANPWPQPLWLTAHNSSAIILAPDDEQGPDITALLQS